MYGPQVSAVRSRRTIPSSLPQVSPGCRFVRPREEDTAADPPTTSAVPHLPGAAAAAAAEKEKAAKAQMVGKAEEDGMVEQVKKHIFLTYLNMSS